MAAPLAGTEDQALILAPIGRDASLAAAILGEAGIAAKVCSSPTELLDKMTRGAALAVLTEEGIVGADLRELSRWIAAQPHWSDFPFVLLTRHGGGHERIPEAARWVQALGNVTFLERPFHPVTLVSVVRTALRGRMRQYEARAQLEAHERAEVELRDHRERLQELVAERTGALQAANRQLLAEAAERERAEARLRQAQKMEAVGQLTGGIAHDFNNLLAAIMGNLELISGRAVDERIVRWASNGMLAAERGAKLTSQLLAFSRMQHLTLAPVDLNALVDGMRSLIERSLGPGIELAVELDPTVDAAVADANQLELAILNLAINARDAMPDGGRLTVTTAPAQPSWNGEAVPMIGEFVSVTVADTGTGMSPNVLERAFEPFFTTKGVGKGTGLGLSQVYGIAKQSGGTVTIDSVSGRGTTVRILLPRAAHAAAKQPGGDIRRAGAAASTGAQRATVLVVDDDADVRRSLADSLDALGYQVLEAEHGQAGLEALARDPAPDVMILDFAMPGLTGAEVAQEALRRRPDLPILIATGYADTSSLEGELRKLRLLRKPFHVQTLADAIEEALPR